MRNALTADGLPPVVSTSSQRTAQDEGRWQAGRGTAQDREQGMQRTGDDADVEPVLWRN